MSKEYEFGKRYGKTEKALNEKVAISGRLIGKLPNYENIPRTPAINAAIQGAHADFIASLTPGDIVLWQNKELCVIKIILSAAPSCFAIFNFGHNYNRWMHYTGVSVMKSDLSPNTTRYTKGYTWYEDDDVMTIAEWNKAKNVSIHNEDGQGFWLKNGFLSEAEVFKSEQEYATHVLWLSK